MAPTRTRLKYEAGFKLKEVDCDDVPDETVDNEWDSYNNVLTDADMLDLFNSVKMKKNYHETILAVQVNPNFLVVFLFLKV